jgi:hypothetical protein
MRMFDQVAILTDQHLTEHANALRAALEAMRLRVELHRVVQDRNVTDFFTERAPAHRHTVIMCHGTGPDASPSIDLTAVRPPAGADHSSEGAWEPCTVALSPQSVPAIIGGRGRGTLISTACGSGRPALGEAMLAQGYDTYVAPSTTYVDTDATLAFAVAFFYGLLAEDRDYATARPAEDAFALAGGLDPGFAYGPGSLRMFTR